MADAIEYLELGTEDPCVIAVKVTGRMKGEDMAGLIDRIETVVADGRKARLYVDVVDYRGYDLGVVREKLEHMGTLWNGIERCAYVVGRDWMATAIGLVDAVTPMHLRAFPAGDAAEARAWVLGEG